MEVHLIKKSILEKSLSYLFPNQINLSSPIICSNPILILNSPETFCRDRDPLKIQKKTFQMSLFCLIRGLLGCVKKLFLAEKNTCEIENLPPTSWKDLPNDLIGKIALKLDLGDLIRMSGLCRSWDAVINLSEDTRRMLQQDSTDSQIPWLLQEQSDLDLIHFYSLSEGKRYKFLKPKCMRESICCGTSNGWLIMVDDSYNHPLMFMWNPLSDQIIPLPSLSTIPCYSENLNAGFFERRTVADFIKRVQVFSVSEHVLVVAAILGLHPFLGGRGQSLVLCTPEQEGMEWTIVDGHDVEWYFDILHHNGMLYVVQGNLDGEEQSMEEECKRGALEVSTISLANNCEVSLGFIHAKFDCTRDVLEDEHEEERFFPDDTDFHVSIPFGKIVGWFQLAESSTFGELLLVTRTCVFFGFYCGEVDDRLIWPIHNETRDFKVEKIMFENDKSLYTLAPCTSLNNRALFIGSCGALAYDSELYEDCIWFLPSELYRYDSLLSKDSGVFCLRDKSIKRCLPSIKAPLPSTLGWFTPKLL